MDNLTILSTLRALAKSTIEHCERQEFKPEFIYRQHNDKVNNLLLLIKNNSKMNTKQKVKANMEIKKLILAPVKEKAYYRITSEVTAGLSKLTSAIDFHKR